MMIMPIFSRPPAADSLRAQQLAAADVLRWLLNFDLSPVMWRLSDIKDYEPLVGQLDRQGRGSEQLGSYLAQYAEVLDGTFTRSPIKDQPFVSWRVTGVRDGVQVKVWAWVSEAFDAAHELPTAAAIEGLPDDAEIERLADESDYAAMLKAVEETEDTGSECRGCRDEVPLGSDGLCDHCHVNFGEEIGGLPTAKTPAMLAPDAPATYAAMLKAVEETEHAQGLPDDAEIERLAEQSEARLAAR